MFLATYTVFAVLFIQLTHAFDCSTRKDGFYPSNGGCTDVFWRCWAGNAFRYTCQDGLFFRGDAEYCDYKEKVPNCQKPQQAYDDTSDFDCSSKTDGYHMRQELFYCKNGDATKKNVTISEV
ncbi:Chitin binding domain-containing protein [Aphelenchoides bicaudatus]|nr:Chitin binding domain-containing protein [Aphelenchoides bicaudatus]